MPRYKTVLLCGYETWSLALRDDCSLRVTENWNMRRLFEPKKHENGIGENFALWNFIICTVNII